MVVGDGRHLPEGGLCVIGRNYFKWLSINKRTGLPVIKIKGVALKKKLNIGRLQGPSRNGLHHPQG
jgi:hypothetical protein